MEENNNSRERFNNSNSNGSSSNRGYRLDELKPGYTFDFEGKKWKITNVCYYTWSDNSRSREFEIRSGGDTRFIEIEEGVEEQFLVTQAYSFGINGLEREFTHSASGPESIEVAGQHFTLLEKDRGTFRDAREPGESEQFTVWDYQSEDGTQVFSIEVWDWDNSREMFIGKYYETSAIGNVTPGTAGMSEEDKKIIIRIVVGIILFVTLIIIITQCSGENGSYSHSGSRYYFRSYRSSGGGSGK